ncbi:MAG: dimethyl sulfoxide reductase anchor subunit [Burkholderiaceae bacterium]|nr:dimethyl sulfoxide reductase anchor subunit [Burkholderiaceae bacterium]
MKPALSVVFFTVSSGVGLGLMIWASLARLLSAPPPGFDLAMGLATGLFSAGLLSSSMHLANPRNGWRAFAGFRRSWLSREAVFAVLVYPVAALFWWEARRASQSGLLVGAGIMLVALALMVLVCTAMIYACLKTVPHWRSWHTVLGYPLFGLMSGALLWLAVQSVSAASSAAIDAQGGPQAGWWPGLALVLLAAGGVLKLAYYLRFARAPALPSLNAALGLPAGRVRLLDVGHSGRTFLTDEFVFALAREKARGLRWLSLALGFVLPAVLLVVSVRWAGLALLICLAGLLVERWLYFAEAQHVVRVYHGSVAAPQAGTVGGRG